MEPFAFQRRLSASDLTELFADLLKTGMQEMASELKLSKQQSRNYFPSQTDVRVVLVNASAYLSEGRQAAQQTALRIALEQTQVFEEVRKLNAAQGGDDAIYHDTKSRMEIAQALMEDGALIITTAGGTRILLMVNPDYPENTKRQLAEMLGIEETELPDILMDRDALRDMHLLRTMSMQVRGITLQELEAFEAQLETECPDEKARTTVQFDISELGSKRMDNMQEAAQFDYMMNVCRTTKSHEAVQQYYDALLYRAFAQDGEMAMIAGHLLALPEAALRMLQQDYVVSKNGAKPVNETVAFAAKFLSGFEDDERENGALLFGEPVDKLVSYGLSDDVARKLNALNKSVAAREDVKQHIALLRTADADGVLSDLETVVPFMLDYLNTHAPEVEMHASLRDELADVFTGKATHETYELISRLESKQSPETVARVCSVVMAQRYLEAAQRLMPRKFKTLGIDKNRGADVRLHHMEMLRKLTRPASGYHS